MKIDVEDLRKDAEALASECFKLKDRIRTYDTLFKQYVTTNRLVSLPSISTGFPETVEHLVPSFILNSTPYREYPVDIPKHIRDITKGTEKVFTGGTGWAFIQLFSRAAHKKTNTNTLGTMYELFMYILMAYNLIIEARRDADFKRVIRYLKYGSEIFALWSKLKTEKDLLAYAKMFNKSKEAGILLSVYRRTMRRVFNA